MSGRWGANQLHINFSRLSQSTRGKRQDWQNFFPNNKDGKWSMSFAVTTRISKCNNQFSIFLNKQ